MNKNDSIMRKDWIIERLGDFALHEKGKKPKNQKDVSDDNFKFPYIDIKAFEKGIFKSYTDGEKCKFCTEEDFLMVWDGSRSGLVGKGVRGALGSTLVKINFPGIDNNFAFYFLKSKYQQINTRAKGVGIPHVDPSLLWNYDFPVIPLSEQRAIVAKIEQLFSDLDNGIANLKQAQAQLKVYRQAVLKKAFEGELTKDWREQQTDLPSANELLKQIKNEREKHYAEQLEAWQQKVSTWEANGKPGKKPAKPKKQKELPPLTKKELAELPKLPKGWQWENLSNISLVIADGDHQAPPKTNEGIPFITISNINPLNEIEFGKTFYVSPNYYNTLNLNRRPQKGDVLYTVTGSFGIPVLIDYDFDFCFQRHIGVIRPTSQVNQKWLYYLMTTSLVYTQASRVATGTAQKTVPLSGLRSFSVPLLDTSEQEQIVSEIESRLSVCDNVEAIIENSLQQSEALRQSILKKAFAGKLLTKSELTACRAEPDWEPAEKLLKRIKAEKIKNNKKTRKRR
jgi:type I restriction enzyme, S subunit